MSRDLVKSSFCSSLQSMTSATSVSISGVKAVNHSIKRLKDATDIAVITQPLKRSKHELGLSGLSSPAISDIDEDRSTVAEDLASTKTSVSQDIIKIDSDHDELEKELGKCIHFYLVALSHMSFLSSSQEDLEVTNIFIFQARRCS